jgi:hypothetical protein
MEVRVQHAKVLNAGEKLQEPRLPADALVAAASFCSSSGK